jgi:predicted PurR-regulated permease PerM
MVGARFDLARTTLAVLCIVVLIGASIWILRPFLPAMIWATTVVIATWPLMRGVQARLWGSRALAVIVMTLVLLVIFITPFWLAIGTIVDNSGRLIEWAQSQNSVDLSPPAWVGDIPLVGQRLQRAWQDLNDSGLHDLLEKVRPYAGDITQWFLGAVGGLGVVVLQFLLTLAIAAIMYARGEQWAMAVIRFGARLAGPRGEQSVLLAGRAIRGVALGVVVTAFVQTAIGGIGLAVAGVPFAAVLCAVMFFLCIAQVGPGLILIPAVVWMYTQDDPTWATILLVCTILAMGIDNFLRPILIRKGADLPLLLILAGVIGGLVAFGLIGIFLGPTILAVGYTLLEAWIAEVDEAAVDPVIVTRVPTAGEPLS